MQYCDSNPAMPARIRELPTTAQPVYRLHHVGPQALADAELLAILIQATTLDAAQNLLTSFGGWAGLLTASSVALQRAMHVGPHRAAQIRAALEIGRRLVLANAGERFQIRSPTDAASLLMAEMGHLDQEHLRTVLLDTKNRVQTIHTVYVGSLNTAIIRVGEVFKEAVRRNSAALIVCHNHPSGDPSPSSEDLLVTRQIVDAGKLLDVDVLDHLIVCQGCWTSLRERGLGGFAKT